MGAYAGKKQILVKSIDKAIKKHRKEELNTPGNYPYIKRLDVFIDSLISDIKDDKELTFTSLRVIGKKKKYDAQKRVVILRPICIYTSLREKLLISLANKYLSKVFVDLLHEEIISYRPVRIYHGQEVLTTRDDAFDSIKRYKAKHLGPIYVAECDIQKYYDTINHDVVRTCFDGLVERLKQKKGYADFDYTPIKRILDAYLNSYSFFNNISQENILFKQQGLNRIFEEPKVDLLIEKCYGTRNNFELAKSKIGVPQGGALSTLISNVVLHTVDTESILGKKDDNRFFCRYGDDILLMHTSKKECSRLIQNYCKKLTEYKMIYHEFISVDDEKFKRNDGSIRKDLWNQKSRNPFLWGRNNKEKEQMDWIGFLGYEMRYTGEIRIRRSSLDEKFRTIKRKYLSVAKTKLANENLKNASKIEKDITIKIERFKTDGFTTAKSLNYNKYSKTQALKLNAYTRKWIFKLLYKIYKHENLSLQDLGRFFEKAKELGCFNYLKTINK